MNSGQLDRFPPVGSLGDNQVTGPLQQSAQTLPHDLMVVCNQDPASHQVSNGTASSRVVPRCARETIRNDPPSELRRSRTPNRPSPARLSWDKGLTRPTPSSCTTQLTPREPQRRRMRTEWACACLTTLFSAS